MARRALNSLSASMASSFSSRNNVVAGYWALGLLRRDVEAAGQSTIFFDLVRVWASMNTLAVSRVLESYSQLLPVLMAKLGISETTLASMFLEVEFHPDDSVAFPGWASVGAPFKVRAVAVSRSGRQFVAHRVGRCNPHDPTREQCSPRSGSSP
jgi:hypothetical protein